MNYAIVALAPVVIILLFVYTRDKLEKEPLSMLIKALVLGALVPIPVILIGTLLIKIMPDYNQWWAAFYNAFVVAALTEEGFKFLALFLLIRKSPEFDERFDGIVYAVFIALGFAAIENVMYVYDGGITTGLMRAFTAVPAHALFGISMGYYFALSKFESENTNANLFKALAVPIILHGIYDFILMSGHPMLLFVFIPFLIYLYWSGLKKMKQGH